MPGSTPDRAPRRGRPPGLRCDLRGRRPGAARRVTRLVAGLRGMLGRDPKVVSELPADGAIVAGTLARLRQAVPDLATGRHAAGRRLLAEERDDQGRPLSGRSPARASARCCTARSRCCARSRWANRSRRSTRAGRPYAPIRWVNEWNNLDGTIERGYGGRSIFWDGGHIREDLSRVSEYGRLLASLGINGISINNVNANPLRAVAGVPPAARARRRRASAVGRAHRARGRLRQPADARRAPTLRSARSRPSSPGGRRAPTTSTARFPTSAASC